IAASAILSYENPCKKSSIKAIAVLTTKRAIKAIGVLAVLYGIFRKSDLVKSVNMAHLENSFVSTIATAAILYIFGKNLPGTGEDKRSNNGSANGGGVSNSALSPFGNKETETMQEDPKGKRALMETENLPDTYDLRRSNHLESDLPADGEITPLANINMTESVIISKSESNGGGSNFFDEGNAI
ncbi:MAG: hypothetical protein P0S93_00065, partial [Candidatus Neptunochlamydia sp.]|nr:hypothetical protein [Candidatus Neptunochlamydia sp.]